MATAGAIKENPSVSSVVFRARTKLEEAVRCSVSIRDFPAFAVDEPPESGGQDSAANPVEPVLAAPGACQEIMYSAYASVMDILCSAQNISGTASVNGKKLVTLSRKAAA